MKWAETKNTGWQSGNIITLPGHSRQRLKAYTLPVLIGLFAGSSVVIVPNILSSLDRVNIQTQTPLSNGITAPSPSDTSGLNESHSVYQRSFMTCGRGNRTNCVVDGDTFRLDGEKIRIADIDTPEIHPSRCTREETLGQAAKQRLQELLNAGPFSLHSISRDRDIYGRKLRIIVRNGQSLGMTLVQEGLARSERRRRSWCD